VAKSQTADQHSQALRQLEQLNLLRESNVMLRNENERSFGRIRDLQQQVISLHQWLTRLPLLVFIPCCLAVASLLC
jgi:hypothetical protein